MSSSKFASLEGVDFESPDVYETHSPSPTRRTRNSKKSYRDRASNSSDDDSGEDANEELDRGMTSGRKGTRKVGGHDGAESSNPEIVAAALNPEEASKRFQQATGVDGRSVDFSSSIQKRKKRPQYYPPATFETSTYELGSGTGYRTSGGGHGPGDEESWTRSSAIKERPIDKFRRLRYEMEELEKELKEGALTKDDLKSDGGDKAEKEEGLPSGFMLQLSTLRDQLVYLEEQGLHAEASSTSPSWTVETRKLITRLSDHSGRTADVESKEEVQEVLPVDAAALAGRGGDSSKFAALDNRLAGLEELIGVKDAMADETKTLPRPLLPALARIEHLLTLLTHPRHLDGISRRIKVLVSELERLHEARRKLNTTSGDINQAQVTSGEAGGGVIPSSNAMIPLETMQKLGTVMPLLSKTESLLPVVPALLARLHSLAALHTSTNSFVENIDQLEAGIKRSQTSHDEMRVILSNLEASFSENQKRVESNMQLVEERMENITTRIKNLHNG